jgi:hypothetical protein
MIVHLIDGTYELFRHFYGLRRFHKTDPPFGAASGVLHMVAKMFEDGATHIGVATDHIIESFRNELWPGYKTGAGIERALFAQFHPLEEALPRWAWWFGPWSSLKRTTRWPRRLTSPQRTEKVEKVCIWTPDKDLAQCVVGDRVVQIDRRKNEIRDEQGVRAKFGVAPEFIPTIWRWSAMPRTVIRVSKVSAQRPPRHSSIDLAMLKTSLPMFFTMAIASSHCCLPRLRLCASTRRSIRTSASSAGIVRTLLLAKWLRRLKPRIWNLGLQSSSVDGMHSEDSATAPPDRNFLTTIYILASGLNVEWATDAVIMSGTENRSNDSCSKATFLSPSSRRLCACFSARSR